MRDLKKKGGVLALAAALGGIFGGGLGGDGYLVKSANAEQPKRLYVYDIGSPLAMEIHFRHFAMGGFLSYMLGNDLFTQSLKGFDEARSEAEPPLVAQVRDAWRAKLRSSQHGNYANENVRLSEDELRMIAEKNDERAELGSRLALLSQLMAELDGQIEEAIRANESEANRRNEREYQEALAERERVAREIAELNEMNSLLESSLQTATRIERVHSGWAVDERLVTPARVIPWEVPHQLRETISLGSANYTLRDLASEIARQSRLSVRFEADVFDPEIYVRAAMPDVRDTCRGCYIESAHFEIERMRLQEALTLIAARFNLDWTFIDEYNSIVFYRHTVKHIPAEIIRDLDSSEMNLLRAEINSAKGVTGVTEISHEGGILIIDTPIRANLIEEIINRRSTPVN